MRFSYEAVILLLLVQYFKNARKSLPLLQIKGDTQLRSTGSNPYAISLLSGQKTDFAFSRKIN